MLIRGAVVGDDLTETAHLLGLSVDDLRQMLRKLMSFYQRGNKSKFHDASLEANRLL